MALDTDRPQTGIETDRYFTVFPETRVEYQLAIFRTLAATALYAVNLLVMPDMLLRMIAWGLELAVLFFCSGLAVQALARSRAKTMSFRPYRHFAHVRDKAALLYQVTGGFMLGFAGSSSADAFPLPLSAWGFHLASGCLIAVVLGGTYKPPGGDR